MRQRRHQRGAVLYVATAAIVAVVGAAAAVVDVSTGLLQRTRMQAAADAGALAASHHLMGNADESAARAAAKKWVGENGYTLDDTDVSFFMHENGRRAVSVKMKENVPATFARLFGINYYDVAVDASAVPGDVMEIPIGLIPLGLVAEQVSKDGETYWEVLSGLNPDHYVRAQAGTNLVLKMSAKDNVKGNFLGLGIDGSGAKTYHDSIVNGSNRQIGVNEYVETETGNMMGPTKKGFDEREKSFEGSMDPDAWREVFIPLINKQDWQNVNGNSKVRVIGFGVVKITDVKDNGEVSAVFMSKAIGGTGTLDGSGVSPSAFAPVLIKTPPSLRS